MAVCVQRVTTVQWVQNYRSHVPVVHTRMRLVKASAKDVQQVRIRFESLKQNLGQHLFYIFQALSHKSQREFLSIQGNGSCQSFSHNLRLLFLTIHNGCAFSKRI